MRDIMRRRHSERGAALLETALTLPLLLLLSVGIFEFGRAYQTWQVLTNAAREGARLAVVPGNNDAAVRARVKAYLDAGRIKTEGLDLNQLVDIDRTADVDLGGGNIASASQVTLNYPFDFIVLQPIAQLVVDQSELGSSITMGATATMRNEQ